MKTCDKCHGTGKVYEAKDVDQLAVMIQAAAAAFPYKPDPWELPDTTGGSGGYRK